MKTQAITKRLLGLSLALCLSVVCMAPASSWSAGPVDGTTPMMEGKMKQRCHEMKKVKEKMRAEMKAQDAGLAAKVSSMNAAPSDQKQILMAELITDLVGQRTAMHEEMAKMEEKMMNHMMEHMQMGKKSMAECPMMKGMKVHPENAGKEGTTDAK